MDCMMRFEELSDDEAVCGPECTEGPLCEEYAVLHDCSDEPEFEDE